MSSDRAIQNLTAELNQIKSRLGNFKARSGYHPHASSDWEAELTEALTRGGSADAKILRWDGSAFVDANDRTITVKDLSRIPIGKKLQSGDRIGVRRPRLCRGLYILGDYDCEDLVNA